MTERLFMAFPRNLFQYMERVKGWAKGVKKKMPNLFEQVPLPRHHG